MVQCNFVKRITTKGIGIVGLNVPLDTLYVILEMICWVRWPIQQCYSTEDDC